MLNKSSLIAIIFLATFFLACGSSNSPTEDIVNVDTVDGATSSKLVNPYQSMVERSLSHRVKAYRLFEELEEKEIFSGADLNNLHYLTLRQLSLKDEIAHYVEAYKSLVDDAGEYSEQERMKLIMTSLSALLLRYDNYIIAYINYENHRELREVLNDDDSAYDIPTNTLLDMTKIYNSLTQREDVKKLIEFYDANIESFSSVKDNYFLYLKTLIEQSPSYTIGFDNDSAYALNNLSDLYILSLDSIDELLTDGVNELSKFLGNKAGLVETRKGKLYSDDEVTQKVSLALRAGDILLEKTPFRLTDKLIPGHWGHAAIYIGTSLELQDLGIWDHEVVVPFQEQILAGKRIDEALRDDVQLNSVEHFLNIDDLAILRDTEESDSEKVDRILLTLRQLGKEYDFNYDIETSDKIVCSELVYATSILIDWKTESLVGINTISPDNVAIKSIEQDSRFTIELLYHDGVEIEEDKITMMKTLLEEAE